MNFKKKNKHSPKIWVKWTFPPSGLIYPIDFRIAGISHGLSMDAVQNTLGKPDDETDQSGVVTWVYHKGLTVMFMSDKTVCGITVTSREYPTRRGLRVNDVRSRVEQLYFNCRSDKDKDNEWSYETCNDNDHPRMDVEFEVDSVKAIEIYGC